MLAIGLPRMSSTPLTSWMAATFTVSSASAYLEIYGVARIPAVAFRKARRRIVTIFHSLRIFGYSNERRKLFDFFAVVRQILARYYAMNALLSINRLRDPEIGSDR